MKRLILALLVAIVSCKPSEDAAPPTIKRLTILTPKDSLTIHENNIKLPLAAKTGTVLYYEAKKETNKLPIIMIPSTGLTDYIFTETPDGRDSWADIFSKFGHDVYVYNNPSLLIHDGIDYSAIMKYSTKLNKEKMWVNWGMGNKYNTPQDNVRYPVKHYDSLTTSLPYYTSYGFLEPKNEAYTPIKKDSTNTVLHFKIGDLIYIENLKTLINKVKNCILLVHASSSTPVFDYINSKNDSNHIKGIITIEPKTTPNKDVILNKNLPLLAIYSNYTNANKKENIEQLVNYVNLKNGKARLIDLPANGINGNTHLLMQDNNNGLIASIIMEWIDSILK